LTKVIGAVTAATGPLQVKPLKIVAGLEPENTNALLQGLAKAAAGGGAPAPAAEKKKPAAEAPPKKAPPPPEEAPKKERPKPAEAPAEEAPPAEAPPRRPKERAPPKEEEAAPPPRREIAAAEPAAPVCYPIAAGPARCVRAPRFILVESGCAAVCGLTWGRAASRRGWMTIAWVGAWSGRVRRCGGRPRCRPTRL
jgi:hypothetical protein